MIRQGLINSILSKKIKDLLNESDISPQFNSISANTESFIDSILNLDFSNNISYKSILSSYNYNFNYEHISALLDGLQLSSNNIIDEYSSLSSNYIALFRKIKSTFPKYKNQINILTDRFCLNIDTSYRNEIKSSICGHIGNFITLPYFINSAKLYNGNIMLTVSSNATIQFSNFDKVTSLPIVFNNPSFKTVSTNDTVNSTIKIVPNNIESSAFYINIESDKIVSSTVNIVDTSNNIITKDFNSGEIFVTFDKLSLSYIEVKITYNNYNTGKPYSVLISDLIIFENLEFMSSGVFKSKPLNTDILNNINYLTLNTSNITNDPNVNINQSISISNNESIITYSSISPGSYIDTSVYYLNRSYNFTLDYSLENIYSVKYNNTNKEFIKIQIGQSSPLWDLKYDKAHIINGVNTDFLTASGDTQQEMRYQNWQLEDDLYKTNIINFSSDVNINIGEREFILNNKTVSGNILIPNGISSIAVYQKDIDLSINPTLRTSVIEDKLYPFNFAYMFTGIPEFNSDSISYKTKNFNVNNQSTATLYINELFLVSGLSIQDNNGHSYSLHLGANVTVPLTYTVQPNNGIIKICLYPGAKSVEVNYFKASQIRTPIGVLFSNLLTYKPITATMQNDISENIFSIEGNSSQKTLYILKSSTSISNSQILYNNINESSYISTMVEMQTKNKYISPTIKNIVLSVR